MLQKEIECYKNSMKLYLDNGRQDRQAMLLNNLAMAHLALDEPDIALEHANKSLDRAGDPRAECYALCTQADILIYIGKHEKAIEATGKALSISREINQHTIETHATLYRGRALVGIGRHAEAVESLNQALALAEQSGSDEIRASCQKALSHAYECAGNVEAAFSHFKMYQSILEEMLRVDSRDKFRLLQVLHRTENALREAKMSRKRSEELEEQNAELDAFSHTVAHDLRNPLGGILNLVDSLDQGWESIPPTVRSEMLQSAGEAARRSLNIMDGLLLLANVRSTEDMELESVDLEVSLDDAWELLQHLVTETGAVLEKDPSPWPRARGFQPWLVEVWLNYLSNAMIHGGHPPLMKAGWKREGEEVLFYVSDNGPGLSQDERRMLFLPFEKLHQVRSKGHGLGLSIVKRIITRIGGTVGVESPAWGGAEGPSPGSTFFFTLPAASPSG
jgi:signal transduction histidine kinase/predicted negative regulator of RcsB-dependent stress response